MHIKYYIESTERCILYITVLQKLGIHTHNQPASCALYAVPRVHVKSEVYFGLYCIICNCPFSHYRFCQITHCFFDLLSTHYKLFSVWPSGTELGGALYILFPSVFVFFPGLLGWFPVFAGPLHLVPGLLYGRPVWSTQDPPVYRPGESHSSSRISWERGGCL